MTKLKIEIGGIQSVKDLKKLIKIGFRLFLFGETHDFVNDLEIQEKILKNIKPEIYIYELLENKSISSEREFKNILSNPDSDQFSVISTFGDIKPTIEVAKKYCKAVIGCDLENLGRKDNSFLSKKELTPEEEKFEEELLLKREKNQGEIINNTLKKSSGTIFVSVGAYHLRKDSKLLELLDKEFVICFPTLNGIQEFGQTEEMKKKDVIFVLKLNKYD